MKIIDMLSINVVTVGFGALELFGAIITNNYLCSIRFFNILHMNLEDIRFFTRLLLIFITTTIENFNMSEYILRLVFHRVGKNEFENYEMRIKVCFINVGLTLNELVISIGVKKNIFLMHDTFAFEN